MIWALFYKEFKDSIRDKRAVFAALLGALVTPILFAGMMIFTIEQSTSVDELYIEVVNPEQSPQIVSLLEQSKIFHVAQPEKGKKITVDGEEATHSQVQLTFDETFAERMAAGKLANIKLTADYSKKETNNQVRRIKRAIQTYEGQLVSMKLVARGVSPNLLRAIDVEENDTSSPSSKAALLLGMLGVFIISSVFVSSTNVAIDCSAGERERNSLELLLMQPVSTLQVVIAKSLNTSMFGAIGATLSIALTAVAVPFIPLHKAGMAFHFDLQMAVTMWLLVIPLALFAAAFQLASAFHAKSFKEAQSYIQYTIMIPILVPMGLEIANYKHVILSYLPIFAQQQAMSQMIRGELESITPLIGGSLVTIGVAIALVKLIANSLKSEKVVLGL